MGQAEVTYQLKNELKDPKKSLFPYHGESTGKNTLRACQQKPLVLPKQASFRPDHLPISVIQEERHDMTRRQFEEMNKGSTQKIEQLQRKEIVPDVVPSQDKDPKKSQFPYHDTFRAYQQKPLVLSKQDAFRPDHLPTSFIQEERHDMMRRQFEEMNESSSQKIEQLQRKEIVPDV
eukprot:5923534-Ditylum_brightwellii.AAC.1